MFGRFTLALPLIALLAVGCVPAEEEEAAVVIVLEDDEAIDPATNGETTDDPTEVPNDDEDPVDDEMPEQPEDPVDCVDADGDGWSVGCGDAMSDCNDADPNNWMSCELCVDVDGDGYFTGCDAFDTIAEDCADDAPNVHAGAAEIVANGVDDDCDATTPDECSYQPTPATDPESGFVAGMTRLHNLWRWRVGVPPLAWNAALAADALDYAEACIWEHDPNRSPGGGFNYVGENLYATTVSPSSESVLESVQAWADERYDFDFGFTTGQTTGGQVGHYTQMVWHETTQVGCAYAWCNNGIDGLPWNGGTMVVCRYGPGGNYTGEAPYDYQAGACLDLDNDDVWQAADPDDTNRAR